MPRAVFKPHVSRQPSTASQYFEQACNFQSAQLAAIPAPQPWFAATGVLQLVASEQRWRHSNQWQLLNRAQTDAAAGVALPGAALQFADAGWLHPPSLCQHWLDLQPQLNLMLETSVETLQPGGGQWALLDAQHNTVARADIVVVANGATANTFSQTRALPLQLSRGQLSQFELQSLPPPKCVITGRGVVIPTADGVWSGASHQRLPAVATRVFLDAADQRSNQQRLDELCPRYRHRARAVADWAGQRASTADRLPLLGPVPDAAFYWQHYADLHHGRRSARYPPARYHRGLYILAGLGSRGASQAGYAGELLARQIIGAARPVSTSERAVWHALHPARFMVRALRRGQPPLER